MKSNTRESLLFLLFLVGLTYRILLCFEVPTVTSDAYRSLGFASHAYDKELSVYTTPAEHFKPEAWSSHWGHLPYIYPPVTLIFFYLFSIFHLGIVWVKLTLTVLDLLTTYLFYKHVSKLAAFLFFLSPAAIWYTSHEAQYEALQTVLMGLTILSVYKQRWFLTGFFFAFSTQSKLWGFCLVPWLMYKILESIKAAPNWNAQSSLVIKILAGIFIGVFPFFPFYLQTPNLLLLPLRLQQMWYNPFAWNFLNAEPFGWIPSWLVMWNTVFTYGIPLLAAGSLLFYRDYSHLFKAIPFLSFWGILKSLIWAESWYVNVAPSFLFCLKDKKKLVLMLMILMFFQCGRSISLILGKQYGAWETPESMARMKACMYSCSFKP